MFVISGEKTEKKKKTAEGRKQDGRHPCPAPHCSALVDIGKGAGGEGEEQ